MPHPLWPALSSLPVGVPLYFLSMASLWAPGAPGVFPRLHGFVKPACSADCMALLHPGTKVPFPTHLLPGQFSSCQKMLFGFFAPHRLDLATCWKLINVYWNDLSNNDLSAFILRKAQVSFAAAHFHKPGVFSWSTGDPFRLHSWSMLRHSSLSHCPQPLQPDVISTWTLQLCSVSFGPTVLVPRTSLTPGTGHTHGSHTVA